MLRRSVLFIIVLISIFMWPFVLPRPVLAEPTPKTLDIVQIAERGTYLFTIGYDQGTLHTTLIGPDGSRYPQDAPPPGCAVATRQGITIFRVEQASPGIWQAECLEDHNGRVGIVVQRLIEPLRVSEPMAAQADGSSLRVRFALTGETGGACSYQVYLSTDGELTGARLIGSGAAAVGQSVDQILPLTGVGSYAHYRVVVRAETSQSGFTDFHEATSPEFTYTAPGATGPPEQLQANLLPQAIELSWSIPPGVATEGALVAAYAGAAALPYYAVRLDGSLTASVVPLSDSDSAGRTRLEVALIAGGQPGNTAKLTIDASRTVEQLLGCVLPAHAQLLPGSLLLPYQADSPIRLRLTLNGQTTEHDLHGAGTLSLVLPDGLNRIRWQVVLDDEQTVSEDRLVYSDAIAPILRIFDDPDGLHTTADTLLIAGNADDAVWVRVNGQPVSADNLNNFRSRISLAPEDNRITVEIADQAGNTTRYLAVVRQVDARSDFKLIWILLIATLACAITAWLRKHLARLLIWLLTLVLLFQTFGGASGSLSPLVRLLRRSTASQTELVARAALERGDTIKAWPLLLQERRSRRERAEIVLLCARAALLGGDLAAAGHYYALLAEQDEQMRSDLINPDAAAAEIKAWQALTAQPDVRKTGATPALAALVWQHVQADHLALPGVASHIQVQNQVQAARTELNQLSQSDTPAGDPAWQALDVQLEQLSGQTGGAAALALLSDSLLAQDKAGQLVTRLRQGQAAALLELADRILTGDLKAEDLPGDTAVWLNQLIQDLIHQSHRQSDLAPQLILAAVSLRLSDLVQDAAGAHDLLLETAGRYPAGTGLRELDRILSLLAAWQDPDHPLWTDGDDTSGFALAEPAIIDALPEMIRPDWSRPGKPDPKITPTPTPPPDSWPDELAGSRIRTDLQPLFNLCAPEMTQNSIIRFFVTLAAGSAGFPGGVPDGSSFEFRTNIGFRRLLSVQQFQTVAPERYTMLILDNRPFIPAQTLALQRTAALAYVRSMPADEKVLLVIGGIPYSVRGAIADDGQTQVFGNSEMTCHRPTSDKAKLEALITTPYPGDVFASPDLFFMVSWPLEQMTAINPDSAAGDWATTGLGQVSPWLGQVIVFSNGDPDGGVTAGGDRSIEYVRGAAIAANAAIHFVGINPVRSASEMTELAEAGRGAYIDPSVDDLFAFYDFVRNRPFKIFLAECRIPENPHDTFFELWGQHLPTGVMAGFRRNPGRGMDLIGTPHYSDASLSAEQFTDYTGPFDDGDGDTGPGGPDVDPFEDPDTGADLEFNGSVTQFADGELTVLPPDRHAIARSYSGTVLVTLPGSGFAGLQPEQINLTIPGMGRINPAFIYVAGDDRILFYLPVNKPAGLYTLNVSIGNLLFTFPDTFLLYDVDGWTNITFGPWTISAAGMQPAGDGSGDWLLSGARINDWVRFTDEIRLSGDWLSQAADALTVTPLGNAYVAFDADSDSLFVETFFLDDGSNLSLGCWQPITLARAGGSAAFSSRQWEDVISRPLTFGFFDFPYDTGTLYPDRIEIPLMSLNLDLPLQEYILMSAGMKNFSATSSALLTARRDDLDLLFEAELSSDVPGLKCFGALGIKGIELAIDTSISRVSLGIEAELIPDKSIRATIAIKGVVFDELSLSIDVAIPVTTSPPSPIPVSLTELGGGVRDLADAFSGDPMAILGVTIFGTAKFEAGSAADFLPFLRQLTWLKADKIPPALATDNTELSVRAWPFSLAFATDVSLFDAFPIGHAELSLGFYAFNQTLLGISDDDAVGLHALLMVGPDIDFQVFRIGYSAGPSLDINNHGVFIQLQGGAWAGINLGPISLTVDMTGKFLIAVHDIPDSSWPQLAIVANAVPSIAVPGLWDADDELDIRLLINEHGVRLIGIPSPIDQALSWLKNQITDAAAETWDAVTDTMDSMIAAADATWDVISGAGSALVDVTVDVVSDLVATGSAVIIQTGSAAIDVVDSYTGDALSGGLAAGGQVVGSLYSGVTGWFS